mmetsp:Transcript_11415/g.23335  ORF Transcript_11415/g.23335 Transcript_11415/m.23335 type:complete len:422 (+) Transcript_11415:251-1516(+)
MSSGNRHSSAEDGSEDSNFSSAGRCRDHDDEEEGGSSRGRNRRNTSAGRKRKSRHEPSTGGQEYDDMEFSFFERSGDKSEGSKDDSGGSLGISLMRQLDDIKDRGLSARDPGGKRRKQQGRAHKTATATRSATRGWRNARGGRSGPALSSFLDRADDIQSTEGGDTSAAFSNGTSKSRRTAPVSLTATPRRNSSRQPKGKTELNGRDGWTNTRGSGEATLTVGALGMVNARQRRVPARQGKILPSTTTRRSKKRNAQDAAGAKVWEQEVVDILSDDDDAGSTPTKHSASQARASTNSFDHVVAHSTPASERSHDGVRWNPSDSESEIEDFVGTGAGDRSPSSLPGKRNSPINLEKTDSNSSQFSITKVLTESVAKTARFFGVGGSKRNGESAGIIAQNLRPFISALIRRIDHEASLSFLAF